MSFTNEVSGGGAPPESMERDQLYVQHASGTDKILALWTGDKSDNKKVLVNRGFQLPGDGNDYDMQPEDRYVGADTTTSGATITTPSVDNIANGHEIVIEDHGGNATSNNITVDTPGDEHIDGADTASITTNDGILKLIWDAENSNWRSI